MTKHCSLDAVNMCCWTHGTDITEADYVEGYCELGWALAEDEDDDEEYYLEEE